MPSRKTAAKPKATAKPKANGAQGEGGKFVKGKSGNPAGKPKGTTNKLSADMKTMIEQAMKRAGTNVQKKRRSLRDLEPGTAYLADQAEKNPVAFMGLAKGLLPAKIDLDVTVMSREIVTQLSARREQLVELRKMRDVTPKETDDV